ncbi:hypothetical protein IM793_22910 [Pedobacter sp. MR2016-19]|uniref:hypothetical protein n=1 Tax=Pedobacter sp. MR2016-19 TaxID=2780089 RepID=UPI0018762ECF|nr:hypothetical protein [Pedobacter sp. MR2016-19]MBE5322024.1 hypothetical protein [Pedobacter sp. MR2016-19]
MKIKFYFFLLLIFGYFSIRAQDHVFVLVDVSSSRKSDPIKFEAQRQVMGLLTAQYNQNGWTATVLTDRKISDLVSGQGQSIVGNQSWMSVIPFGAKNRYQNYKIQRLGTNPQDFQTFFGSNFPRKFGDNYTYIQIAEAFTASLAKTYNIDEYYMFVITDALGDQDDTDSRNDYTDFEQELLLQWNNSASSIVKNIGTLSKSKYYIQMRRVTNVQNSQIPTTTAPSPVTSAIPPVNQQSVIKILSPSKSTVSQPVQQKGENINVSWSCNNCPSGAKFNVILSGYGGSKFREPKKDLTGTNTSFKKPTGGKYKIIISAANFQAQSDLTFIEVSPGGSGILFLAAIIILGIVGYFFWDKSRRKKVNTPESEKSDDIFSKSSDSSQTNSNSNSTYF